MRGQNGLCKETEPAMIYRNSCRPRTLRREAVRCDRRQARYSRYLSSLGLDGGASTTLGHLPDFEDSPSRTECATDFYFARVLCAGLCDISKAFATNRILSVVSTPSWRYTACEHGVATA